MEAPNVIGDRRLRTLIRLAEEVEGAAYLRVSEAIRERRQELEREDDDLWEGPLPPSEANDVLERGEPPVAGAI